MSDGTNDARLETLLAHDVSVGTDDFRERLLGQCLDVVGEHEPRELSDEDIDLLFAAGDIYQDNLPDGRQ